MPVLMLILVLASAALFARGGALVRGLRQRRFLLVIIAALLNGVLWITIFLVHDVITGMTSYKWGLPLQCFMIFDSVTIPSFIIAFFVAPRCEKTDG